MTYEEFMTLPYVEGEHYQLIEGELVVTGGRTFWHQAIVGNLLCAFLDYFAQHRGGTVVHAPLDVVLSRENVLHPDVLVIRDERRSIIREENVQGAPDIAIEVVCEDTRHRDEVMKRRIYERYGVTEYWMVDADQCTVTTIRDGVVTAATDPITTPLFRNFALPLREIFAR